jgi:membrane protein DedA with SNARE-associated domain
MLSARVSLWAAFLVLVVGLLFGRAVVFWFGLGVISGILSRHVVRVLDQDYSEG